MTMRRWILCVAICLAIAGLLASFKVLEIMAVIEEVEAFPEYSETVEAVIAQRVDYQPTIEALGEVRAPRQVELRTELAGAVVAVPVASGAVIKQGELIVQLDTSEEQAKLKSARASQVLAASLLKRAKALRSTNAASEEQLDRANAELEVISAEIEALKSVIRRKTIRAPFDGVLGIHQLEVGQFLDINTPLSTLVGNSDVMWVEFQVPQFYRDLAMGSEVLVKPVLTNTGQPPEPVKALVVAKNSVMNGSARSRLYRASVAVDMLTLTPQQAVQTVIPVGELQPRVAVPVTAIRHDQLGQYVYLLSQDEAGHYRAHRQSVSAEIQRGDNALVIAGLQEGERIAAAGAFKLHEGLLVNIRERLAKVKKPDAVSASPGAQ